MIYLKLRKVKCLGLKCYHNNRKIKNNQKFCFWEGISQRKTYLNIFFQIDFQIKQLLRFYIKIH